MMEHAKKWQESRLFFFTLKSWSNLFSFLSFIYFFIFEALQPKFANDLNEKYFKKSLWSFDILKLHVVVAKFFLKSRTYVNEDINPTVSQLLKQSTLFNTTWTEKQLI